MRMRCVVAGVLTGIAASLVQGQPLEMRTTPIDDQSRQVLASVFDDRSGPRLYRHDTVPPSGFLHATANLEWVGIHGFDAIGGKDIITSISCMWGNCTNGATGRLIVWQADSTGDLKTAVPLLRRRHDPRRQDPRLQRVRPLHSGDRDRSVLCGLRGRGSRR